MSNTTPFVPIPDDDDAAAGDSGVREQDGKRTLDPDTADELIDSADADRLAAGGEDE